MENWFLLGLRKIIWVFLKDVRDIMQHKAIFIYLECLILRHNLKTWKCSSIHAVDCIKQFHENVTCAVPQRSMLKRACTCLHREILNNVIFFYFFKLDYLFIITSQSIQPRENQMEELNRARYRKGARSFHALWAGCYPWISMCAPNTIIFEPVFWKWSLMGWQARHVNRKICVVCVFIILFHSICMKHLQEAAWIQNFGGSMVCWISVWLNSQLKGNMLWKLWIPQSISKVWTNQEVK